MTTVQKQGVLRDDVKKLKDALAEFIAKNPAGNPDIEAQIERAEMAVIGIVTGLPGATTGAEVIGAARALQRLIDLAGISRLRL